MERRGATRYAFMYYIYQTGKKKGKKEREIGGRDRERERVGELEGRHQF